MADQAQQRDPAAADGLITAQQAAIAQIRAQITAAINRLWAAQPNYRSPDQFIAAVVPLIAAGQQQIAAITAAYLSQLYAKLTGTPVSMVGVAPNAVTELRSGVDPAEVYARPFHLVWRQLAAAQTARDAHFGWTAPTADAPQRPPLPPSDYVTRAIDAGRQRAVELATTDLQLAKQHAAQQVLAQQDKVTGYRRVLEGPYSCGLCIVAATQIYHRSTLMPIHPGCDCSIEPVIGDHSGTTAVARVNGQLVPLGDLPDVHDRIAHTFGRDSSAARAIPGARNDRGLPVQYRDVLITHDHGELGPVLAVRGQAFTGPNQLTITTS